MWQYWRNHDKTKRYYLWELFSGHKFMSIQDIHKGIGAIRQGHPDEGARFLRIALRDTTLDAHHRAMALLWLAETTDNNQSKLNYYQEALALDPSNIDVQARLDRLLAVQLPPTPPLYTAQSQPIEIAPPPMYTPPVQQPPSVMPIEEPSQTPLPIQQPPQSPIPSVSANALYRTVGIRGVRNGRGTGFFITKDGIVVTTRYVVSGERVVRVQLDERQEVEAQVIRAYPDVDVVFLDTGLQIQHLLQPASNAYLPEHSALTAHSHYGKSVSGKRRATKSELQHYWIPTTIDTLPDAGGLPLFNDSNLLVGMLTKNTSKTTPYYYGVHIHHIYLLWDGTQNDLNTVNTTYCGKCGRRSMSPMLKGGFYCEYCGSILPYAEDVRRFPTPDMSWKYGENQAEPCEHCHARVGYYKDICLRCGKTKPRKTKNKG